MYFSQKMSPFILVCMLGIFFIVQLVTHVPNGFWTHNLIHQVHHLFLWKNEVSFEPEFIGIKSNGIF